MENPIKHYWQLRLQELQVKLEDNNFRAFVVTHKEEAEQLILETLLSEIKPQTVSYGGSLTLKATGVLDKIDKDPKISLLRPDEPGLGKEEKIERRRQGLLVDLYIMGTNAVTEEGQLVNLDMVGNRVGALTFGPQKVIVLVGRNKIVPDLETAMYRIKYYASPTNAMRLDCKTPCVKTSECADCKSPGRICNTWTITEKSFPRNRVSVILINQELGL